MPRLARGFAAEVSRPVGRSVSCPKPLEWNPQTITASWIGHATVLINFQGLSIITDPVLSNRIGLSVGPFTLGPKRLVRAALAYKELPTIDLVLLSHSHLDHLHMATLMKFPATTKLVTALGMKDLVASTPLKDVAELGWGEGKTLTTRHGDIYVEAFEVNHWGARWGKDAHRGYNGYILERNGRKILFGGDTGYTEAFKKLKSKGPFELAIMPIGSYKPGEHSHCTPEEAVAMANDAGANYVLPIHHKTFNFGKECSLEPMRRFEAAIDNQRIALRDIGETFCIA